MPSVFYVENHARNDLFYLERFVVYVIAPVYALSSVLGDYLLSRFAKIIPDWRNPLGSSQSSRVGGGVKVLFELLERNREILEPDIYRKKYFAT
jgi:hypothetical protein